MKVCKVGRSTRKRDSIIVLQDGRMAEVTSGDGPWKAKPVILHPYDANIGIDLPWDEVGVHEYGGLDHGEDLVVRRPDVSGKGFLCGGVISSWLQEWFSSKVDD